MKEERGKEREKGRGVGERGGEERREDKERGGAISSW